MSELSESTSKFFGICVRVKMFIVITDLSIKQSILEPRKNLRR